MPEKDLAQDKEREAILAEKAISDFASRLSCFKCQRCSLASADRKQVVVYRGNPRAKIVMLGEAPGKWEDVKGLPFVGPAGELTDKIFASVGIDTRRHLYIGNVVKCRPRLPPGSGKENRPPRVSELLACRPYFLREIQLLDPKIVIACGLPAARSAFGLEGNMKDLSGKFLTVDEEPMKGRTLMVIYHPAAVLHVSRDPAKEKEYKQALWNSMKMLRKAADDMQIDLT